MQKSFSKYRSASRNMSWSQKTQSPVIGPFYWLTGAAAVASGIRGHAGGTCVWAAAWAFTVERVTGIEPALSARELDRHVQSSCLTRVDGLRGVTAVLPNDPELVAR